MKSNKELDGLIHEILDLEGRGKETKEALEKTREDLQAKIKEEVEAGRVSDHPKLTAKIMELESRLKAIEEVTKQKRQWAEGLIRDGRPAYQKKVAEVEKEIKQLKRKVDTHMINAVAQFAHEWGCSVEWPTVFNGGVIKVGAVSLQGNEVIAIADKFKEKKTPPKEEERRLNELHEEVLRLSMLDGPPNEGLDHLLMVGRRKRGL